ncbi:MAG: tyrosine-type recombinase/integrase [Actinomycetota bacterium]
MIRDANGKQRWVSGFPSIRAAEGDRDKTRVKVREGNYSAPTRQSFEEVAAEWLETRRPKLKPSTVASYADLLRDHINPRIGRVPLQKLTAEHLDALYTKLLTKGRRNGTGGLSEDGPLLPHHRPCGAPDGLPVGARDPQRGRSSRAA